MSEKKSYVPPILEISNLGAENIMTTSGGGGIELPDHDWK